MLYNEENLALDYEWQTPDFEKFTDSDIESYKQWLKDSRLKKPEEIENARAVTSYPDGLEITNAWGGWLSNGKWADWRRFCIDRNYASIPDGVIKVTPDFTKTGNYIKLGADYWKSAKKFPLLAFDFDGDAKGRGAMRFAEVCDLAVSAAASEGKDCFFAGDTDRLKAYLALGCGVKGVKYRDKATDTLSERLSKAEKISDRIAMVFSEYSMASFASFGTDKQYRPIGRMAQVYSKLTDMGYQVDFIRADELSKEDTPVRIAIVPDRDGYSWYELVKLDKFGKEKGTTLIYTAAGQYEKWSFDAPKKNFYSYYKEAILEHELLDATIRPTVSANADGIILRGVEGDGYKIICVANTSAGAVTARLTLNNTAKARRAVAYSGDSELPLTCNSQNGKSVVALPSISAGDAILLLIEGV
ncbi:MAG: hypothetical protein IKA74_00970 [Clostridia bacterium]|nr:hypothetical protein [Clostridia bacterium]